MAPQRTERLLNLVIALVATRRWLTKGQIRRAVPQYARCGTDEAFDRMFERDKEDLRDLGVPLVTGSYDVLFDDEPGYRIDRATYALPEIEFTASELAVLGLASQVWQQASLAGPATRALTKLRALGIEADTESLIGVEPRIRAAEPAFDALYAATRDRAPVRFHYRKPNGETSERRLQPWALISRGGHWYVVGFDTDRGAPRVFRLSRFQGAVRTGQPRSYEVPPDVDTASLSGPPSPVDERAAVLQVRPGRGTALRLRTGRTAQAPPHQSSEGDSWDRLELPVGDLWTLAEQIAGHGPDVVVVSPPDLRAAVVGLLLGAQSAQANHAGSSTRTTATSARA
jgi:predicted DNA-binding transcriptional regulator YafY